MLLKVKLVVCTNQKFILRIKCMNCHTSEEAVKHIELKHEGQYKWIPLLA